MDLLYDLFTMSVTGSIVFLLFKITEQVTKRYFSASWHYGIMKCIILFLCIPMGAVMRFLVEESFLKMKGFYDTNSGKGFGKVTEIIDYSKAYEMMNNSRYLEGGLITIWLVVMGTLAIRQILCFLKFRYIIAGNKILADHELYEIAESCGQRLGIKKPIHIYINEFIDTPMLIGFFSPIILLPTDQLLKKNAEYVLTHELIHYKNKDLFVKSGMLFIRMVHWFNPVIYLFFKELNKWCEYACDEENVINLSHDRKKQYGLAILESISVMPIHHATFGTPFLLPNQNLKERLMFMLDVKKMNIRTRVFAVLLAVLLLFTGMGTAFAEETQRIGNTRQENYQWEAGADTGEMIYQSLITEESSTDNPVMEDKLSFFQNEMKP